MNRGGHGRGRFVQVELPKDKKLQRKVIKRIFQYIKKYPLQLTIVLLGLLFQSGVNIALPFVIKVVIDDYININTINLAAVGIIIGSMVLVTVVMAIGSLFSNLIMGLIASKVTRDIRKDTYEKLQKLPIKYYDQTAHGDIMSVLTNDIETINQAFYQVIPQLITSVITFIGAVILMLFTSVTLSIVALLMLPLVIFSIMFITTRAFKHFRKTQSTIGKLNGIVEENITGLKAVKLYNQELAMIDAFNDANESLRKATYKANLYSGMMMPIIRLLDNLLYAVIITVGAFIKIKGGNITVGEIQSMTNYSKMFVRPISNLAQIFNLLQAAVAGGYRVFKLIDEQDEYKDDINVDIESVKGDVEFRDVSFGYNENLVLKNINFKVKAGTSIAIVGPTGSGKTTIINLLTRFYEINQGEILIDGKNIQEFSKKSIRKNVGIVLQNTFLFKGTILENIGYARPDATYEEIVSAAKLAQVHDIIDRLPKKYDTIIKEGGHNFSHGERQLISIARTILANKSILVLDEATSSVDTRTESKIQQSIDMLKKGRTSFIIAHRLQTIRNADLIIVLKDGEILEAGNHEQLLANKNLYYQMHTLQVATNQNPFDIELTSDSV